MGATHATTQNSMDKAPMFDLVQPASSPPTRRSSTLPARQPWWVTDSGFPHCLMPTTPILVEIGAWRKIFHSLYNELYEI